MSVSTKERLRQERVIITVVFIFMVATISFLTFRSQRAESTRTALPPEAPLSVVIGDEKAPQKMVVYTDPVCDKCAQFHNETLKKVYDDYVKPGKLQLEVRPLSIVSEHSAPLTHMLMCGSEQGKYWETTGFIYDALGRKNGKSVDANAATFPEDYPADKITSIVGLNFDKLVECANDSRYDTKITQADQQAYAANIYSTPTTFVGTHEPVRGMAMYPYIKSLIDIDS